MKTHQWRILCFSLLFTVLPTNLAFASSRAEAAWSMIANGALIIDVRTEEEFAQGHLEQAQNIPLSDILAEGLVDIETSQPIVVYCRSGNRSQIAMKALIQQGFTHIYNGGGLEEMRHSQSTTLPSLTRVSYE